MNRATESHSRTAKGRSLARGLGWFSLALGAAELLAPRAVARAAGIRTSPALTRLYGLREIAAGIGILVSGDPSRYVMARLGGDALDLMTLGTAAPLPERAASRRRVTAIVNVTAVTALDARAAVALAADKSHQRRERAESAVALYSDRSGFPRSPEAMRGAAVRTGANGSDVARAG
ncbi:hypothetical protein [Caballeronia sp. LZ035]|uniref:hypothetical protein n=1 Tax=Caballeronia sp. LZ035 TaxID=3038568 RepID=UPI00285DDEEC|nr:hypothetical protein [Caballeronia sp. LZ035]MDR5763336.1 hypothetical protein [Caballeronia sp. LZ035]